MVYSNVFKRGLAGYIFDTSNTVFLRNFTSWELTIHASNPGTDIPSDVNTDTSRHLSKRLVTWNPVGGDYVNGVTNAAPVSFDYVPKSGTWTITNLVLWGISGVSTPFALINSTFSPAKVLSELQILHYGTGSLVYTFS